MVVRTLLEHPQAHFPETPVRYWRDKARREIDFTTQHRRDVVDIVECKWEPAAFDSSALRVFRSYYPKGRDFLVTRPATRRTGESGRKTRANKVRG